MSMTDPIADMLTRIRNGQQAKKTSVTMPGSKVKIAIAEVLKNEGYIGDYRTENRGVILQLTVDLKYFEGRPVIEKIRRVSKPGRRVYQKSDALPSEIGGLGIAIISTSHGIMTEKSARAAGIGGEVLCTVH